jgi:hypothetical protein
MFPLLPAWESTRKNSTQKRSSFAASDHTGHIFEYLWFQKPPHLRNAVVRPASACNVAPTQVAQIAERTALFELNENRLLLAA